MFADGFYGILDIIINNLTLGLSINLSERQSDSYIIKTFNPNISKATLRKMLFDRENHVHIMTTEDSHLMKLDLNMQREKRGLKQSKNICMK